MVAHRIEETEGPTPAGGDRSVAYFVDDELVEIEEWLEDVVIARTYGPPTRDDFDPEAGVAAADEQLTPDDGQDALKSGTWDLWHLGPNGEYLRPVEEFQELLAALDLLNQSLTVQRTEIGHFLSLPAWEPAPQGLKDDTYAWLLDTRQ